jgi:adenylosuccinate synthase
MKADYQAQISEYPAKLYFKYKEDGCTIDMSTVQWYATAAEQKVLSKTSGWSNKAFWGAEATDATQKNLKEYLPKISGGLNSTVKNRYVMPLASTTISASNGMLSNSYGFNN